MIVAVQSYTTHYADNVTKGSAIMMCFAEHANDDTVN
jgi:hypothetical protein